MKARYMAMAAIFAVALAIDASAQDGVTTTKLLVDPPRWPSNGIAERELGDGQETWPENMFVEYSRGRLIAWVIASTSGGRATAIDFFSGEIRDVKVKNPGGRKDAFVDAKGVMHTSNTSIDFYYMDPCPGGDIGNIVQINQSFLYLDHRIMDTLDVSRRFSPDDGTVIWRKVPLYCESFSSEGPCERWSSHIGTAIDLRDGTMLITAGKYVFRVRTDDLTPVGHSSNLHVFDREDVERVVDKVKRGDITNAHAFLSEELHLQ